MAKFSDYARNEYLEIALYLFLVAIGIFLTIYGGFSLKGFSEQIFGEAINVQSYLGTLLTYIPLIILGILLIIFPVVSLLTVRQGQLPVEEQADKRYKWTRILSVSYIFAPENGLLARYFPQARKWLTFWKITIFSLFLFSLIGIIQIANPVLNVFGVPNQAQQLTATSDVIFGSVVPAIAENGALLFLFFTLLGLTTYFLLKFVEDKQTRINLFFLIAFFIVMIGSASWGSFHSVVYGNSSANIFAVIIFGFFGLLLTLITGTLLPFLIWHITNNAAIILRPLISPSNIPLLFVGWVVLLMMTIGIWIFSRRIKRRA